MRVLKNRFCLCILIISISYYEVIYKPFPFINMTYANSIEQVNDFSFNDFHSYEFRNIDLSTAESMSDFQNYLGCRKSKEIYKIFHMKPFKRKRKYA